MDLPTQHENKDEKVKKGKLSFSISRYFQIKYFFFLKYQLEKFLIHK